MMAVLASLAEREPSVDPIGRRAAAADPRHCLCRFLDYPPNPSTLMSFFGGPKFKPNPDFWLKGIDFSCVSPWNDSCGRLRAGTAISKRHIVFAKHFPLWKGVRILFVGEDGGVCPCSIEATRQVADSDIMIGLLNAELTPNIRPARILPANFGEFLGSCEGMPVVTFSQHEKAFLTQVAYMPTNGAPNKAVIGRSRNGYSSFRENLVGGDSGNPAFLMVGEEPVLLYCVGGGGYGTGRGLHYCRREIQSVMDEMCSGYKLEEFDFTKGSREDEK